LTLENLVDNKLPFLDPLVLLQDGTFKLEVFNKPTHSGTCLTFDSHPLIISENLRVERIASEEYLSA
jgi:hypothetical protein